MIVEFDGAAIPLDCILSMEAANKGGGCIIYTTPYHPVTSYRVKNTYENAVFVWKKAIRRQANETSTQEQKS